MEQSTLTKWDSYLKPPTDDMIQAQVSADEDTSTEDYTVTTSGTVSTSSIIKLAMAGGFSVLVLLVMIGIFYFMSANSTPNPQAQRQRRSPKSRMETDKDRMLTDARKHQTFSDRHDTIQSIDNQNKGKPTTPNPAAAPPPAATPPPPTVTPPRVVYRSAPPTASPRSSLPPQRTFRVQKPASVVAAQPEPPIDDPNYGFFTAPPSVSSQAPKQSIQLTKSKQLAAQQPKKRKGMVSLFKKPVQIASAGNSIPVSQPDGINMVPTLSGNLTNPYLKDTVASASATQNVIPVDTVIDAQIKTRVTWTPENPGLANGKDVRMVLKSDVQDPAGNVIARKGDVALGKVTQATEQGLTSVTVSKIGNQTIQPGSIEVHQEGDPTLQARLESKGGRDNKVLKAIAGMGADGLQTLTQSLNKPTNQTSFNNGNQTFLSSSNNRTNRVAAFAEGASARVGEMIRNSDTGPTQSAIGVYRLKGNVQLYVVREVQL